MKKQLGIVLLVGVFGLLAGCSSTTKEDDAGKSTTASADSTQGADMGGSGMATEMHSGQADALSKRVIYFEFDSSDVTSEAREIISAHAQNLSQNANLSVVLEGHADERGTREYNVALGESRAKAVKQLLVVQGVSGSQIQVISFGEERPAAVGHDESAWGLNRRVELLYSGS
ncbi:Tol-Pal system peptidoglycan-associated lipoprotein PAL [hydrothermal vent metagenome]|uniref:Tol-Pal system peptidoglycan-associated lipoprotein PAL n=1 Tax=hydrothermal vent metagenome TaxID=652676 RepID=A0A3B1ACT1_9ZZZZ